MSYKENKVDIDVVDRINAMLYHEKNTGQCHNYLTSCAEVACRKAMIDWCFTVSDSFDRISRESVSIAASILDRYLSSGKGRSAEALPRNERGRRNFQLASITSFYTAAKIAEPASLGMKMLLKLCRGFYTEREIVTMEKDILSALDWRITLSTTTPMEYVRHFLEILPDYKHVSNTIIENAMSHMDNATSDIYFSTCKMSEVGVACLMGALNDTNPLSSSEKEALWRQLSQKLDFDLASNEINQVEMKLLAKSTGCIPRRSSVSSLRRSSKIVPGEQMISSPVCVTEMAA